MCDTLYASKEACSEGRAWFAKNSDRHPEEPQTLCIVPRRQASDRIVIGSREYPFPDPGLSFAISRPTWMRGGEMGVNERGVAIGNEAVFSRIKPSPDGVLGMDILRAALASSESAEAAVDFLCRFTEANAQGGNGAYKGHLVYNNSYLVASGGEAYIVETAGNRWAWREIDAIGSISNAYSIEEEYKRLDLQTRKEIAPVNERAACSDEADAGRKGRKESWRSHVESRFYLLFTRGDVRRAASYAALERARGGIDARTILGILRSHGSYDFGRPRRKNMESLCIHPGAFPVDSATTASFAVEYLPGDESGDRALLWFTGTSYPCLSVYKPVLLDCGRFMSLWRDYDYTEDSVPAREHWERQSRWVRRAKAQAFSKRSDFAARRDESQARIVAAAAQAAAGGDVEAASAAIDTAVAAWYAGLEGW